MGAAAPTHPPPLGPDFGLKHLTPYSSTMAFRPASPLFMDLKIPSLYFSINVKKSFTFACLPFVFCFFYSLSPCGFPAPDLDNTTSAFPECLCRSVGQLYTSSHPLLRPVVLMLARATTPSSLSHCKPHLTLCPWWFFPLPKPQIHQCQ